MRVLVALGGNAMAAPDGSLRPADQIDAAEKAMASVADLIAGGDDVVITHGNGPQVGDVLVKNEIAARATPPLPPVPLDWCVAQTQATMGFVLADALDAALLDRGIDRRSVVLLTRTLVDVDDPHFQAPSKPIGRFVTAEDAASLARHGETFADFGQKGRRRVVASPEPLDIVDGPAIAALVDAGFVVIAAGGGGVPVVREHDGSLRGVEAVVDKDLSAALLARIIGAERLVIATDVDQAVLGFDTTDATPIGHVDVTTMRGYLAAGEFGAGSMRPKIEAVCRFVEQSGHVGVVTSLAQITSGAQLRAGTVVVPSVASIPSVAGVPGVPGVG